MKHRALRQKIFAEYETGDGRRVFREVQRLGGQWYGSEVLGYGSDEPEFGPVLVFGSQADASAWVEGIYHHAKD